MALSVRAGVIANRIVRFGLTTSDAGRLINFYEQVLDCRLLSSKRVQGTEFERLMRVSGGAQQYRLTLGNEIIEMLEFDKPGRPYPADISPLDSIFQHFAIVVSDIHLAVRRLSPFPGWAAITRGPPQRLPDSSGGVSAYKFRDPDGHPLEFLSFPDGHIPSHWKERIASSLMCGIDHSAISVRDTLRSVEFFRGLSFEVNQRTDNHGVEQQNLDDIDNARVSVTALTLQIPVPHMELLCYEKQLGRSHLNLQCNDVASTRIVLETNRGPQRHEVRYEERIVLDPEGHRFQIVQS